MFNELLQQSTEEMACLVRGKGPIAAIAGLKEYLNYMVPQLTSDLMKKNMSPVELDILLAYTVGMLGAVNIVELSMQPVPAVTEPEIKYTSEDEDGVGDINDNIVG